MNDGERLAEWRPFRSIKSIKRSRNISGARCDNNSRDIWIHKHSVSCRIDVVSGSARRVVNRILIRRRFCRLFIIINTSGKTAVLAELPPPT